MGVCAALRGCGVGVEASANLLRKGTTRDLYLLMDESKEAEQRHLMRRYYGRFTGATMPAFKSANLGQITYGFEQAL